MDPDLLKRLYQECDGYAQRVHEKLVEDEGIQIQYSTLTRLLRDMGLRRSPEPRCDRVPDEPGAEMQHDTSPYVGGGEKGYQNGGEVVPCQGSRSE